MVVLVKRRRPCMTCCVCNVVKVFVGMPYMQACCEGEGKRASRSTGEHGHHEGCALRLNVWVWWMDWQLDVLVMAVADGDPRCIAILCSSIPARVRR